MEYVHAIILGVVQGVSEFLPVSSSGHLVIAQKLLGVEEGGLTLSVALHFGSLLAVVAVLWREWWLMASALVGRAGDDTAFGRRLFLMLVLASLPVAIVGFFVRDAIDAAFTSAYVPGVMLLLTGLLLWYADRTRATDTIRDVSPKRALAMGIGQSLALLPGLSRSGTTMATGIFTGLKREEAARFSFLMAVPAIFGASLLEVVGLATGETSVDTAGTVIIAGALASLVTSYIAIRFFLSFLQRGKLIWFARYVWALGALVIILTAIGS